MRLPANDALHQRIEQRLQPAWLDREFDEAYVERVHGYDQTKDYQQT